MADNSKEVKTTRSLFGKLLLYFILPALLLFGPYSMVMYLSSSMTSGQSIEAPSESVDIPIWNMDEPGWSMEASESSIETPVSNFEPIGQSNSRQSNENLRRGQMVDLCGSCELLYEVPIRAPLEVRHRIGVVSGNREAMILMEPVYLDDISMWFVKVDLGYNNIFGWVPISCINQDC